MSFGVLNAMLLRSSCVRVRVRVHSVRTVPNTASAGRLLSRSFCTLPMRPAAAAGTVMAAVAVATVGFPIYLAAGGSAAPPTGSLEAPGVDMYMHAATATDKAAETSGTEQALAPDAPTVGELPGAVTSAQTNARCARLGSALWYIWSLVDGGLLLLGCTLTLASVAMQVLVPIKSAALLKAATEGRLTVGAVLGVLAAANAQALLAVGGSALLLSAGDRLKRSLRESLFAAILAQELEWVNGQRPGALIATITSDTEEVGRAVSHVLGTVLASVASVSGSLASLTFMSPMLTGLVLSVAPPVAAIAALCARREGEMRKVSRAAGDAASAGASEVVEKLTIVQAFAQEEAEAKRYCSLLAHEGSLERRVLVFHKAWTTLLQLLTSSSMALALALAGSLAAAGNFDASLLLPFSQLAIRIGQVATLIVQCQPQCLISAQLPAFFLSLCGIPSSTQGCLGGQIFFDKGGALSAVRAQCKYLGI